MRRASGQKEIDDMGKFRFIETELPGVVIIEPTVFGDNRGYFMETYNYNDYKAAGIDMEFVQDNQSSSRKGVLRGLHFQINYPQDKLVRVVSGEVFDVAVDLRNGSSTYGKWHGVVLSAENKKLLRCSGSCGKLCKDKFRLEEKGKLFV